LERELATRGFTTAVCASSVPDGDAALRRSVDVSDSEAVDAFGSEVFDHLGPIDLWVNNAGVLGPIGFVSDTTHEAWVRCIGANVLGTVAGCRSFLNCRAEHAVLINIASRAGLRGTAGLAAYSATKAAVIALTQAIADEADPGLRAVVVIPPSIDTDMQADLLSQDPMVFPGVAASRARRDAGQIVSAATAARNILDAALGDKGPVIDLTESHSPPPDAADAGFM
jgi:NAD(P)-dependent dehydrogenase (short-subunit alcohol dehydrogenase family)